MEVFQASCSFEANLPLLHSQYGGTHTRTRYWAIKSGQSHLCRHYINQKMAFISKRSRAHFIPAIQTPGKAEQQHWIGSRLQRHTIWLCTTSWPWTSSRWPCSRFQSFLKVLHWRFKVGFGADSGNLITTSSVERFALYSHFTKIIFKIRPFFWIFTFNTDC